MLPPLWNHQKESIESAGSRFALFFDAGTGKTRTALEIYKRNSEACRAPLKTLILAPLNVCRNWIGEIGKFLPNLKTDIYLVAGDTKQKKLKTIEKFGAIPIGHRFLIANIESLRSKETLAALARIHIDMVIVDESHNFKSPDSLQTKGLMLLDAALHPDYFYLLTATPSPQGYIDLWSTLYLLKKIDESFFIWRRRNFIDKNEKRRGHQNYWPDYQILPASEKIIRDLLASCSRTAQKDLVIDLPPLLRTVINSEMSPVQARHYETMREMLFAIDEDGNELNAANFLSRSLRLQQIIAGHLGIDDSTNEPITIKDNSRPAALEAAIDKCGEESFIIWTIFRATYVDLAKILVRRGISFGFLTGDVDPADRFDTMEAFQARNIRALIAHPKAGGVGVNLTAASYSIHYTRSFSLTDDIQAEARNYRGGSEIHKRITRIDIVTPDTIDEDIMIALREKKSVLDLILGLQQKRKKAA